MTPPLSSRSDGPDFNVRHVDWQSLCYRWRMAWCFYRGGLNVLSPDYTVYSPSWPVNRVASSAGAVDAEPTRHSSDYEWVTTNVQSFLWRHDRETPEEFSDRHRRLYHLPLFRSDINNYVAGILKQTPTRKGLTGPWEDWHADVDGRGTNVDAMMRRALARSLVFGRMHAVVDRQPTDGMTPLTRAEERGLPLPYCYLVSPLDLVDWQIGDDGLFDWVVIRCDAHDARSPGQEPGNVLDRYTVLTRNETSVYIQQEKSSRKFSLVRPPVFHGLGRVPMATLWATEEDQDRVMACESPFADALDFNRHQLNKLSELDEVERMQTFAILGWPTAEGMPLNEVSIGPNRAVTYDGQAGEPKYISPDPSLADGKWKRIEAQTQLSRTLEGTSRGRAEYSKEERSASAISVESEDKRNRMAWWASAVQEFDDELHSIVAGYLGEGDTPDTAYVKDFDFRATSTQVADIVALKSAGLPKKAIFSLAKGPAERILRENGMLPEDVAKVMDNIDAEAEKPEPAPIVAGSPFGRASNDRKDGGGDVPA